ncbi:Zinc finger MYM-type protein 3 [Fasciola gigantica]|uniref:Zinc finger MYM-type protein 3 n=1 Tax=Fasciola gigantica TaxID=46835 RepID=A0A504Z5Y3_FASGI|nr:Zinc finger MYM-type protein 3 [Fasciola gigantica]
MSVGAYASTVSAIDPHTGQVIELPIDQAGAYIMQDGSSVLTGAQLQANIQGGKSLLKPELAQHLNQHTGYKSSVGRGGLTLAATDPRWAGVNTPRSARNINRKPLSSSTGHMQPTSLSMSQSAALAPTASGLLSLGTRYTPSSASAFGTNAVPSGATGTIVTPAGAGLVSATIGGLASDRDPNYRLAAAIAGTGARGRPRGRRPLRGQFPVVPIDMVRQLGIEQQVILQPAAPVAMRNKAVLCRPLSASRKTQASTVQYEGMGQENNLTTQTDLDELHSPPAQRLKDVKMKDASTFHEDDTVVEMSMETEEHRAPRCKTLDAETSTVNPITTVDGESQTDEVVSTESSSVIPKIVPIPIPVPIYVPVPVCLYARPVPYALPFPLPCLIPLPLNLSESKTVVEPAESESALVEVDNVANAFPYPETDSDSETELPQVSEESDTLVIASEPAAIEPQPQPKIEVSHLEHSLKRRSPSPDPVQVPASVSPTRIPHETATIIASTIAETHTVAPSMDPTMSHIVPTNHDSVAPPAKRPRQTLVVSDANYHLKFSYGINAWRHWVQHKLASVGGVNSTLAQQRYPYLHTELVNMSEDDLNLALSQFVREVRKPNNECYVADSVFYLCLGIQEYLNENGCNINLFGGPTFADFSSALDNILANFQPRISPEGLLICRIEEEHLWEARQLGDQSPEVLLFTMLYFNTKHFGLRLGAAHRQLTLANFHLTDEESPDTAILCHLPDSVFGGVADGTTSLRVEMNLDYPERCPVRLFKAYLSKCPPDIRTSPEAFYLVPVYPSSNSSIWYSATPMDPTELQVILNRIKMVKEIQEAFMNGQPEGGF